jgi:NitT/TauT family transport system permease protein
MPDGVDSIGRIVLAPPAGAPSLRARWSGPLLLLRRILLPLGVFLGALWLWEWACRAFRISSLLLVPPSEVWSTIVQTFPILLPHATATLVETVLGFLLATVAGLALGTMITASRRLNQAFMPYILMFQLVPKIALAPLFIVWLGVGTPSRLAFATFIAFFPVVIATATGLASAERRALLLARAVMATPWQTFLAIRFPYATPHIVAGLKVALTMAMIGVIVGEFVTAQQGLGYIIMFASSAAQTALMLAAIALLCLEGLVLYALLAVGDAALRRRFGAPVTTTEF